MTSFCFVSPCAQTIRACLHGGGGPQIGEETCSGSPHLSCKRDQIIKASYHTYLRSPYLHENRSLERSLSSAEVQWGVRAIFVWPWNENVRTKQKQKQTEI